MKPASLFSSVLALFCSLVLFAPQAHAVGYFLTKDPSKQTKLRVMQIFLHAEEREIRLHIQIGLQSDASEIAWILPISKVASKDFSVRVGSNTLFQQLQGMSAPIIEINTAGQRKGCGGSTTPPEKPQTLPPSANQMLSESSVPIQSIDVFSTFSADPLAVPYDTLRAWLDKEGYPLPDHLKKTLEDGAAPDTQYAYATLRIPQRGEQIRTFDPLILRIPYTDQPMLPLSLSTSFVQEEIPAILFILHKGRYTLEGFASKDLIEIGKEVRRIVETTDQASYDLALRELTAKAEGRKLASVDFSQDLLELCPLNLLEEDYNYQFCNTYQEAVALANRDFATLTRLQFRLPRQPQDALPDLRFQRDLNQEKITGRVLASVPPSVFYGLLVLLLVGSWGRIRGRRRSRMS